MCNVNRQNSFMLAYDTLVVLSNPFTTLFDALVELNVTISVCLFHQSRANWIITWWGLLVFCFIRESLIWFILHRQVRHLIHLTNDHNSNITAHIGSFRTISTSQTSGMVNECIDQFLIANLGYNTGFVEIFLTRVVRINTIIDFYWLFGKNIIK
jgi:hypothetical protein